MDDREHGFTACEITTLLLPNTSFRSSMAFISIAFASGC